MAEILITYPDGSGEITERRISDLRLESATTIDAFCHLRNARRSFRLDRIVHALNAETGELLNPYDLVHSQPPGSRQALEAITWRVIPAVKALKFFTLTTRGFRKREKQRVVQFLEEVTDVSAYSRAEVEEWIQKLWCGDIYAYQKGDTAEYTETLRNIPSTMLDRCRDYALLIARGSGRKPVEPMWLERIGAEFTTTPTVKMRCSP